MINSYNKQQFLSELRHTIAESQIYTDSLRTFAWGTDASFYRMTPQIVIRTKNEQEVQAAFRACKKYAIPFTLRAAGTSLSGQSCTDSVLIVAGKSWENFRLDDDKNAITLQPGITGGRVNNILKPYNRVFPPDPASVGSAMVGGIVVNNASGMNCGVHANSDHMLLSARIILTDGTILDTGNEQSRTAFRQSHPEFIRKIEALRDEVRQDPKLTERIRYKYSIKNVTGLNIRPLVDYDDPFDIIAHSIVGSEGTLAFLSAVRMKTLHEYPYRASAMVYFHTMEESCKAIVALKQLKADEDDMAMTNEDLKVKSAEMLDYLSLQSVSDPVFLNYKKDVDEGRIEGVAKGDYHNLTAVLTETKAITQDGLQANIRQIMNTLAGFNLYGQPAFTDDPEVYGKYWSIRSGIFPAVGGQRPVGSSCLIEDVAFHMQDLPHATVDLQQLIARHGYKDACIYGHAFEGNYHFILNQSFSTKKDVEQYRDMMQDAVKLVVGKYDGSLKAEHGTGRNMAPFVKYEWGEKAYGVMKQLKDIFDPDHILNPGVIFNDDPECFIEHLKPLPVLHYDLQTRGETEGGHLAGSTMDEMVQGVQKANRCIECGFCEINCLSCGFTLSSRMRIAARREMVRLQQTGENPQRLAEMKKEYRYFGEQTCATDGLCATSCPMNINTGDLTHLLRQLFMDCHPGQRAVGQAGADHLSAAKDLVRGALCAASLGRNVLGTSAMKKVCKGIHRLGIPQWSTAMPGAIRNPSQTGLNQQPSPLKVVYLPSCINQTMGLTKGAPVRQPLVKETCDLLHKAGYEVIFPKNMKNLCCGQIWESKGMADIADRKTAETEQALYDASEGGRWPVLCDQSPCLHRLKKMITRVKLYEPAEFILTFLADKLTFHPIGRPVAIHLTCSTREMGLSDTMLKVARMCTHNVFVPEGIGCCGFAGDRGFSRPELNDWALRSLHRQITEHRIKRGYSNSRTCEIGLEAHAGIPYMSIVYLVNECTELKNASGTEM